MSQLIVLVHDILLYDDENQTSERYNQIFNMVRCLHRLLQFIRHDAFIMRMSMDVYDKTLYRSNY